jgi:hypothetical protein
VAAIAEVKGVSVQEAKQAIRDNFRTLFGIWYDTMPYCSVWCQWWDDEGATVSIYFNNNYTALISLHCKHWIADRDRLCVSSVILLYILPELLPYCTHHKQYDYNKAQFAPLVTRYMYPRCPWLIL